MATICYKMWHQEQWKNEQDFHVLIKFGKSGLQLNYVQSSLLT